MHKSEIKFYFKSKKFILTGAGKGIGLSTLKKLYISGATIAYITRSESDIKKIKKNYPSKRLMGFCGDVSKEEDRQLFYIFVKKNMKFIDGLINNAGVRQRKKFENISQFDLDEVYNTNLKSIFFLTQLFLNLLKNKGSVINLASIVGPNGFSDLSGYALSKSGLIGLTKSLSIEFSKKKIRVNSISPGFIKSSYEKKFRKNFPKIYKYTIDRTPLKRWGECEEVSDLILFLLSNNSSFITGNNIFIDGGWSAN
jgi:NAD(P)-dependent dehydrogenase (short-subunit alcohol dehydrogenase family)